MFVVKNSSTPPRTQMIEKSFEFTLPPGAIVEFSDAMSPGGIPIKTAAVPQGRDHYAFIFPLRPGETTFQIGYHLPYSGELKLDPKATYAVDHVAVGIPKSMQFSPTSSGSAFQLMREENGVEMYVATSVKPGQPLGFKISGTGAFPREQENAQADPNSADGRAANNLPGGGLGRPEEAPDALHHYRWWLIGGLLLMLAGGAAWTVTRSAPQPAIAVAAPASRSAVLLDALKEELFQ